MRPVQRTPFSASGPRDRYPMLQRAAVIASLKLAKTTCKTTCFTIWLKSILNTTNSHIFENVFEDRWIISHNHWVLVVLHVPPGSYKTRTKTISPWKVSSGPFWVWPHKNTAKISVFAVFFWSNSIRTYSGCFFFFFPAFFCPSCSSGLITPTSPQHPSPVFLGLRSCFRLPIVNKLVANEGVVKKVFKKCDMPLHTALATSLNIESLKLCYLPSSCYFYL